MARYIDAEKLKKHYAWWGDSDQRKMFNDIVDAQPLMTVKELLNHFETIFDEIIIIRKTGKTERVVFAMKDDLGYLKYNRLKYETVINEYGNDEVSNWRYNKATNFLYLELV